MCSNGTDSPSNKTVAAPARKTFTKMNTYTEDICTWMDRVGSFIGGVNTKAKEASNGYGNALYATVDEPY